MARSSGGAARLPTTGTRCICGLEGIGVARFALEGSGIAEVWEAVEEQVRSACNRRPGALARLPGAGVDVVRGHGVLLDELRSDPAVRQRAAGFGGRRVGRSLLGGGGRGETVIGIPIGGAAVTDVLAHTVRIAHRLSVWRSRKPRARLHNDGARGPGPDEYYSYELGADGEIARRRARAEPEQVDLVYTYRPVDELAAIVAYAVKLGARVVWFQDDGSIDGATARAREVVEAAGLAFADGAIIESVRDRGGER
jgi:hypothetical protein